MSREPQTRGRRGPGRPLRPPEGAASFSLLELMIVVAIIGMINGLTIAFSGREWEREKLNGVAVGLVGWLEEVRANALRQTSDIASSGGCVVTVNTLTNAAVGTRVASVSPTDCAKSASFIIPGITSNVDRYNIANSNAATIIFTPRGSVTSNTDAIIRIYLVGSTRLRCVSVSSVLGVIRVGSNSNATSVASSCTDYSHF